MIFHFSCQEDLGSLRKKTSCCSSCSSLAVEVQRECIPGIHVSSRKAQSLYTYKVGCIATYCNNGCPLSDTTSKQDQQTLNNSLSVAGYFWISQLSNIICSKTAENKSLGFQKIRDPNPI